MKLWVMVILAAIAVSFYLLLFFVALFEKHPIGQFAPAALDQLPEPSKYFLAVNESARQLGFDFVGAFMEKRQGAVYGAYLAVWLSPDCRTLLRIAGGKTLRIKEKKMFLTSYLTDNSLVVSADMFGTPSLSGLDDRKTLLNAHLEELHPFHQNRLAAKPLPARIFEKDRAAQVMESLGMMTATRMKELGLAHFINAEQSAWRYSAKGAFLICARFWDQVAASKAQLERNKLKRPGDN